MKQQLMKQWLMKQELMKQRLMKQRLVPAAAVMNCCSYKLRFQSVSFGCHRVLARV